MNWHAFTALLVSCAVALLVGCGSGEPDSFDGHDADLAPNGVGSVTQAVVRALPARFEAEAFERFADSSSVHEGNCGSGAVDVDRVSLAWEGAAEAKRLVAGHVLYFVKGHAEGL